MDHFSDLFPKLCPDSKIAISFKSKRTKSKCIVRNVLAPYFHEELVQRLQTSHFSVIIDETSDVSTAKELAVVTRVYNSESMNTDCLLYDLLEIARGDAKSPFQAWWDYSRETAFLWTTSLDLLLTPPILYLGSIRV